MDTWLFFPPRYHCLSHHLFPFNVYPLTPVGDAVSNLVSFNIKSLQCLLRSLLSLSFTPQRAQNSFWYTLYRVGRTETLSCSNCGSESPTLFRLVLDCLILDSMRLSIFGHSSILDLRSRHWGLPNYWDSTELIRAPIPRNGSGKPPPFRLHQNYKTTSAPTPPKNVRLRDSTTVFTITNHRNLHK